TDSTILKENRNQLSSLKEKIEDKGMTVKVVDFNSQPTTLSISNKWDQQSPLSIALSNIQDMEEHKNFQALIYVTDGIYNKGINPLYQAFNTPIYTIALGDTIPQKDIKIKNLLYNKISYKGNIFPIHADVEFQGLVNEVATVSLKHKQTTLAT